MRYMVIDPTGNTLRGVGEFVFLTQPQIGEWIEITENEQKIVYEVVSVVHASDCPEVDIYVKRLGKREEALLKFRVPSQSALLEMMEHDLSP